MRSMTFTLQHFMIISEGNDVPGAFGTPALLGEVSASSH